VIAKPVLAAQLPVKVEVIAAPKITVGPEVQLGAFDRRIIEFHAKAQLGKFIARQQALGRLSRPVPDPNYLGRLILKHARRKIARHPQLGQVAIMNAGRDVLDIYVPAKHRPAVGAALDSQVLSLSA
jgi:hypothetical protein